MTSPFSWRDFAWFVGFCLVVETCVAAVTVFPWYGWNHFLVNNAIGFVLTVEIAGIAWIVTPAVAHRVWDWPVLQRWSAILGVLLVSAVGGTWLGVSILRIFQVGVNLQYSLSIAVPITLIAGVTITVLESRKEQLRYTERALSAQQVERERAEKLAAEAQLASLTSRVQPHFLFNTLNSISALIRENPQQAEEMLQQLSSLLRGSLDTAQTIPLESEMKLVRDYLEIQRTRLGERLRYEVDWQAAVMNGATVPPFAIQTLVENAVKHVAGQRAEGMALRLSVSRSDGDLWVEVADDGPGFSPDAVKAGHGLDNLQARLRALYGERAGLEFDRAARGMTVRMRVPAA